MGHGETMSLKILVGWDNSDEIELMKLYLHADDNEVSFCCRLDDFATTALESETWDVVLFSTHAETDEHFETFCRLQKQFPDTPFVGACQHTDVYKVARFLTAGMRSYFIRDEAKDYMFLLQATLENAVEAVRAEKERLISQKLRQEIDSVRKLQQSIIPRVLHSPNHYDIAGRYEPAQIRVLGGHPVTLAGGDYYNAFILPDQSVALIVGDASGHGMKACMSIMTMHTLITMISTNRHRNTAKFVEAVNKNLSEQSVVNEDGGFITLLYAILNPKKHTLEWTSAGHPMPLLYEKLTGTVTELANKFDAGFPLGIVDDATYKSHKAKIPPNSRLLLYTDGIVEAFEDGKQGHAEFGIDGLASSLRNTASESIEGVVEHLFAASSSHTNGSGRHDDTSVLLVERA